CTIVGPFRDCWAVAAGASTAIAITVATPAIAHAKRFISPPFVLHGEGRRRPSGRRGRSSGSRARKAPLQPTPQPYRAVRSLSPPIPGGYLKRDQRIRQAGAGCGSGRRIAQTDGISNMPTLQATIAAAASQSALALPSAAASGPAIAAPSGLRTNEPSAS